MNGADLGIRMENKVLEIAEIPSLRTWHFRRKKKKKKSMASCTMVA